VIPKLFYKKYKSYYHKTEREKSDSNYYHWCCACDLTFFKICGKLVKVYGTKCDALNCSDSVHGEVKYQRREDRSCFCNHKAGTHSHDSRIEYLLIASMPKTECQPHHYYACELSAFFSISEKRTSEHKLLKKRCKH